MFKYSILLTKILRNMHITVWENLNPCKTSLIFLVHHQIHTHLNMLYFHLCDSMCMA